MKKLSIIYSLIFLALPSLAQEAYSKKASHFSLGTGLQGTGSAIGATVSATSPYFSKDLALRFTYGQLEDGQFDDKYFNTFGLGFIWSEFMTERLRGYWQIGITVLDPPKQISDNLALAGSWTLGLEYFPERESPFSLYAELGGMRAVRGEAEKLEGTPHFGRGIYYTTGVKAYF